MIGVAALIIVMSVMNGFRDELLAKILGLNGHVIVQGLERQSARISTPSPRACARWTASRAWRPSSTDR